MLSEEQVKEIKEQLLKQIENFPEEQREAAITQVEAMNSEQLEEFIEKNKLAKGSSCIFCSIVNGETSSYKINENNEALAVLDINPVSTGHVLILPKKHHSIEETPSALKLAQETAREIKKKLSADDIKIETTNVQGHGIINITPIYKNKKLARKKASEQELLELQKKLQEKEEETIIKEKEKKPRKIKISNLPRAPRRIP